MKVNDMVKLHFEWKRHCHCSFQMKKEILKFSAFYCKFYRVFLIPPLTKSIDIFSCSSLANVFTFSSDGSYISIG